MPTKRRPVNPPNPPWEKLKATRPTRGCLSYYLSDSLARLPVRGVTLPGNNKSDPNLETLTYGVFSTCEIALRKSVVTNGIEYVIFLTRLGEAGRHLTGYYQVAWYCESPMGSQAGDYCLAAKRAHFVRSPLPVSKLPQPLRRAAAKRFRLFAHLTPDQTEQAVDLLNKQKNICSEYVEEIKRLEAFNKYRTGYSYIGWQRKDGFDWGGAEEYLITSATGVATVPVSNKSTSDIWRCSACQYKFHNKARLKRCPHCEVLGTLVPA